MTPRELAQRLQQPNAPCLLDVRQPDEHALVTLPGARLIPLPDLTFRSDELNDWKDREVVVYCHHGVRSAMAIGLLRVLGFRQLHNLAGGIDRWAQEVEPTMTRY